MWCAALICLLVACASAQDVQNGTVPVAPPVADGSSTTAAAGGETPGSTAAPTGAAVAGGGDAVGECAAPLQTFVSCVKSEVGQREAAESKEAGGAINDKLGACFTAQSCKAPDFTSPINSDLSEAGKKNWQNLSTWWNTVDSDRRHCVISEIRGSFRQKVQECVQKTISGFTIAPARDEQRLSTEDKAAGTKLAEHRFRIQIALRACKDKTKEVQECLKKERTSLYTESCDTRKKCTDATSAACQKIWVDKIRSTVCGCVSETAQLLKKNIVTDANGLPLKDDQIKAKCGVDLPEVDVPSIRSDPELHTRIKDYVALHEDRRISICHECDGVPM